MTLPSDLIFIIKFLELIFGVDLTQIQVAVSGWNAFEEFLSL